MSDARHPPFMASYSRIPAILDKIKEAQTPERFTQDFLKGLLGYKSGGAEAIIPLMKRIGFLGTDGSPTELYKQFRHPAESKQAMADALRKGYASLFALSEKAYSLSRAELDGLVIRLTGLPKESATVRAISKTFEALKVYANFDTPAPEKKPETLAKAPPPPLQDSLPPPPPHPPGDAHEVGMSLSYTINLNLPETENIAVFNAIFTALRAHLLRK